MSGRSEVSLLGNQAEGNQHPCPPAYTKIDVADVIIRVRPTSKLSG